MIRDLLSEANGQLSTMRFCFVLVVCCIMLPYAFVCISTKTMAALDIGAVSALVGMGMNKWIQKGKESNGAN